MAILNFSRICSKYSWIFQIWNIFFLLISIVFEFHFLYMKLLNALIWNKIPIYFQRAAIQKLNDNNNNNNGFIGKKKHLCKIFKPNNLFIRIVVHRQHKVFYYYMFFFFSSDWIGWILDSNNFINFQIERKTNINFFHESESYVLHHFLWL